MILALLKNRRAVFGCVRVRVAKILRRGTVAWRCWVSLGVCLAAQPADPRRGFEGLALLVCGALQEDERFSPTFVFTNKRRDRIRLLYWVATGLRIPRKKPGAGTLAQPMSSGARPAFSSI